jgi:hypothetical protein
VQPLDLSGRGRGAGLGQPLGDAVRALRHFFIGCHDASGEFLAEDLTIEITDGSYREALSQAVDRAVGP